MGLFQKTAVALAGALAANVSFSDFAEAAKTPYAYCDTGKCGQVRSKFGQIRQEIRSTGRDVKATRVECQSGQKVRATYEIVNRSMKHDFVWSVNESESQYKNRINEVKRDGFKLASECAHGGFRFAIFNKDLGPLNPALGS